MMTKRTVVNENLKNLLTEIYLRTQNPVLTNELWKGKKTESIFTDFGVGKNYSLEAFRSIGALKITHSWSSKKNEVAWDSDNVIDSDGFRDEKLLNHLANKLYEKRNRNKKKEVLAEVNEEIIDVINIDDIVEKYHPEYLKYHPESKTIPKLEKMIKVLKHNAGNRYCDKDIIFNLPETNENDEIVSVNHKAGDRYTIKRLVYLQLLKRNPENKREYQFIAKFDDLNEFAKRLGFASNFLSNRELFDEQRNVRLQKEEDIIKENVTKEYVEENISETHVTDDVIAKIYNEIIEIHAENKVVIDRDEKVMSKLKELLQNRNEEENETLKAVKLLHKEVSLRNVQLEKIIDDLQKESRKNNVLIKEMVEKLLEIGFRFDKKNNSISNSQQ